MLLEIIIGLLIGAVATCIVISYLNKQVLKEEVQKFVEDHYSLEDFIKVNIKKKNYNQVDVGLYDKRSNYLTDLSFKAENSVSSEIRVGDWLNIPI